MEGTPNRKLPAGFVASQWRKGQSGGPGRPVGIAPAIRRATKDGHEIVSFFLSIMRGEVDVIYPVREEDLAARKAARAEIKKQKKQGGQGGADVALALSELLKPSRPKYVKLADRMYAAHWLTNRAYGKVAQVVKLEDARAPLDYSKLTTEELIEYRRMLEIMRGKAQGRVIDVTPVESARVPALPPPVVNGTNGQQGEHP